MGLLSRVLTLPLAPVSGVVWVADRLEQEAQRVLAETDAASTREELQRLVDALERGELDEAEFEHREDELLRRQAAQHPTVIGE